MKFPSHIYIHLLYSSSKLCFSFINFTALAQNYFVHVFSIYVHVNKVLIHYTHYINQSPQHNLHTLKFSTMNFSLVSVFNVQNQLSISKPLLWSRLSFYQCMSVLCLHIIPDDTSYCLGDYTKYILTILETHSNVTFIYIYLFCTNFDVDK